MPLLSPAQAQLAVPTLSAHVMDTTGTLSPGQVQQLEAKLIAFEQSRGTQMVLLLPPLPAPVAAVGSKRNGFHWTDLAIFMSFAVPLLGAVTRRVLGAKLGP